MKGLEEKEGVSQNPEHSHSSQAQQEVEVAVGREAEESGLWNAGGGGRGEKYPHTWPPTLGPELHGEAQGRGTGAGSRGGPTTQALGGGWRLLNSPHP